MPDESLDWMVVSGLFGVLLLVTGVGILRGKVAAVYSGLLLAATVTASSVYALWQGGQSISLDIAAAFGLLGFVLFLIACWHAR